MKDFKTDIENGVFSEFDVISEGIPYEYKGVNISLQIDAGEELRHIIFAAIEKYKNPSMLFEQIYQEMDRKVYSEKKNINKEDYIYMTISRSVDICSQVLSQFVDEKHTCICENTDKMAMFWGALIRLRASFKTAIIIMQHGYFIELVPIFRLIYEQLSWLFFILKENDTDKLLKKKPENCVTYLKERMNDSKYGKLYGDLSADSHMTQDTLHRYYEKKDDKIAILSRSGSVCKEDIDTLLLLYRIYVSVISDGISNYELDDENASYYSDFCNTEEFLSKSLYAVYEGKATLHRV